MFKQLDTDFINIIIIIGAILFVVEITFFNGGLIFSALFSGLLIYFGWKNFQQLWGKVCFWIGTITFVISILNMMAIRFFILVGIALFVVHYFKSKNETNIKPELPVANEEVNQKEPIFKIDPLFDKSFFGDKKTDDNAYSWRDVNIQGIFGDRTIDLSNTVLPNDTSVISIRHLIGDIVIYVPYEVEISIQHSSIFGRATILEHEHSKLLNQTLYYQTSGYDSNSPRVKIITTLLSGDIEVKRI